MEETKELMVQNQNQEVRINVFSSKDMFELGQRMANVFATSTLVPKQYQGNVGNCLIGLNIASRMGADPLMVFQNLVIVHNVPTFEAKFAIACFNATGKYTTIKYREVGEKGKDSWGYIAYAIEKATGDVCEGPEVTIGTAKAEGWYNQNPKWKNIPELMLRYRAASWFIRTTDPGVMMGFQTKEEAEDIYTDYEEVPTFTPPTEANSEELDMPQNKEQEDSVKSEGVQVLNANKSETTDKTEPMGKQEVPNIFGNGQL